MNLEGALVDGPGLPHGAMAFSHTLASHPGASLLCCRLPCGPSPAAPARSASHTTRGASGCVCQTVLPQDRYPGAIHGFDVHWKGYDPHATANARQRTLIFLAQHLRPTEPAHTPGVGASTPAEMLSEVAMHFYTVELPALTHVPGAKVEQLFALPMIDHTRYTYTNENGRVFDYSSRREALAKFYATQEKDGYTRHTVCKIEDIALTDATHGTVTYTEMTMWTHAGSGTEGLTLQPGVSVWERSAGQWRLVSVKHGSPYRAYTQSRSR